MDLLNWNYLWIIIVFTVGYTAIILEHYIKVNKTAVALLIAVLCWTLYLVCSEASVSEDVRELGLHVSNVSQIIFFLMGAMALVELIDSHRGFKIVTDRIHPSSKRTMLCIIALVTFFLSAVLDNLTTTILMVSLLRKLIPHKTDRLLLCCVVVIAANAGGAWSPIGDVTTTMLWINGQISSFSVMKALFIPSFISLLIPTLFYMWKVKGKYPLLSKEQKEARVEPGATLVLALGVGGLMSVPVFKTLTGLPPFMGVLLALSVLWLVTDLMHHKFEERQHLRIPHILTRVDTSGVLFFLGILLCVNALEAAGLLQAVAVWLDTTVRSLPMIAALIGLFSAVIDNVPLVAATMGMYPLEQFPTDAPFWHMIAYAAGTGGSILIVGSSSGVALMGLEKIDFVSYLKKASLPALLGYLVGFLVYMCLAPILAA